MNNPRLELISMLNKALEMEQQANIQYLSHAEIVDGIDCEPIIERLKEIANDEKDHAEKLRTIIGDFLDGIPSMAIDKTKSATDIGSILKTNILDEMEAVRFYSEILVWIRQQRDKFPYCAYKIEHDVRHIVMDEQEHIAELRRLMALKIEEVEKL